MLDFSDVAVAHGSGLRASSSANVPQRSCGLIASCSHLMYAIMGITGQVGVIGRTLLAANQPVRAVVRDAGKGRLWADRECEMARIRFFSDWRTLASSSTTNTMASASVMPPFRLQSATSTEKLHRAAHSLSPRASHRAPQQWSDRSRVPFPCLVAWWCRTG